MAIAAGEPEARAVLELIAGIRCIIGAPVLVECYLVLSPKASPAALTGIEGVIAHQNVTVAEFDAAQFRLACEAFDHFGKGRGHPAQLNFGDCLSYAVAKYHDAPLLYKGNDFVHTDLRSALP